MHIVLNGDMKNLRFAELLPWLYNDIKHFEILLKLNITVFQAYEILFFS